MNSNEFKNLSTNEFKNLFTDEFIDYLYENFQDSIINCHEAFVRETENDGIYECEIILDAPYEKPVDLNQSIFTSAKEFEVKGIKNWFSSKKDKGIDKAVIPTIEKPSETVDINTYNKLQQELEETKKQNVELNSRIADLTTKIDELTNKFTAITPKLNIQAQELGVIGEDTLSKMFTEVGLRVEVKAKVPHVSDLWGYDDEHKILFVIESKNKNVITQQDVEKFKFDLNYIAKHKLQPTNYTIIGLFVSLRTKTINQSIGSCNFTYTETYIGNQCLSQEFLKMYISTIRTLKGVYEHDQTEYKRILESVTQKYNSMNVILSNLDMITKNAEAIIQSVDNAKQLLDSTCDSLKESMIKLNTPETDLIKAEKKILDYLKKTPKTKIKMTTVKELANGQPVFGGRRLTKALCEELMN